MLCLHRLLSYKYEAGPGLSMSIISSYFLFKFWKISFQRLRMVGGGQSSSGSKLGSKCCLMMATILATFFLL